MPATINPPTVGTATTYQAAGSVHPAACGMVVHMRRVSPWIRLMKIAAANAAGIPSNAAKTSIRAYSGGEGVSGVAGADSGVGDAAESVSEALGLAVPARSV
jgi:hypothetical protein